MGTRSILIGREKRVAQTTGFRGIEARKSPLKRDCNEKKGAE